jgi:hypothetical protein
MRSIAKTGFDWRAGKHFAKFILAFIGSIDQKRRLTAINYRAANGLFDHLVGASGKCW